MRREIRTNVSIRDEYESWAEYVDHAERGASTLPDSRRYSRTDGQDFAGTRSFAKAITYARDGWPEGEALAQGLSKLLFNRLASLIERPVIRYDVEGEQVDIARYLDGEPECWQRTEWTVTEGLSRRVVRITFNPSASGGIDKDVLIARGAAVLALVALLEQSGMGCELTLVHSSRGTSARKVTRVPLKGADQPGHLGVLAFALANPSTLRRLIFSDYETYPAWALAAWKVAGGSYGLPDEVPAADRGDIHIDRASLGETPWQNPDAARAWIIEQLKAQGVTVRDAESEKA